MGWKYIKTEWEAIKKNLQYHNFRDVMLSRRFFDVLRGRLHRKSNKTEQYPVVSSMDDVCASVAPMDVVLCRTCWEKM